MSRKRCIRKHYPLVDPIKRATEGACVITDAELDRLRKIELSSLESFRMGKATRTDWEVFQEMLNLCETMASRGIGSEAWPACRKASDALCEAQRRFNEHGRLGLTGPELDALRELYKWFDVQRTSIPRSKYEAFAKLTFDRIRSRHPSLKVLA